MTTEQFEEAQRIERDIDSLKSHLNDISKSRIAEGVECISCQFNRSFTSINLLPRFMRHGFVEEYISAVKGKIAELEREFETL